MTKRAPQALLPLLALLLGCPPAAPSSRTDPSTGGEAPPASGVVVPKVDHTTVAGEPRRGGTFTFGRGQDAVSLDPADVTDGESVLAVENVFDGLVRYKDGSTEVEPALATAWTVSDDRKTWTFTLREGVKFHDDTPCDAAAVVYSFERQRDPAHEAHGDGEFVYWGDQFKFITRVEAVDGKVVFHLDQPFVPFLSNLAMFTATVISPTAYKKARAEGKPFSTYPVGTGPFKVTEWRRGDAIVLEAFDGHWAGRPHLDRVILRAIPDNTTRLQLLKKGDLQGMDGLNANDVQDARADGTLQVVEQPGMNVCYLALNNLVKPFDDPRVRRAVALSLDLDRVASGVFQGLAVPARNPLPPTLWGHADGVPAPAANRDEAKRLLAEAGFKDGFETTLWTMTNPRPYLPQPDKLAQYLKAAMGQVGIKVTIVPKEWASYLEEIQNGDHPMCVMGWTGDNGDPDNFLYVLLDKDCTEKGKASNYSFYRSDEVHQLLVSARVEPDQGKRAELYRQAQVKIHADTAMVPLVHNTQISAFRRNVGGFRLHPTGVKAFSSVWLAE